MTRRIITKTEFLDLYENGELFDIISTPIAVIAKRYPEKDRLAEIVIVNIP